MQTRAFRIADSFTASLHRLPAKARKVAKTAAFDLQLDHSAPGLCFHRVERGRDPNFWTVRVSDDLRIVIHKTDANFLLCYVAPHDEACAWAERRRIEVHPTTGAAQFVEFVHRIIDELAPDGLIPPPRPPGERGPFEHLTSAELLGYGVPPEWVAWMKQAREADLFDLEGHVPQEAVEALLEIATGGKPKPPAPTSKGADPFSHPDAQRRFRLVADNEELKQALDYPWEKWTVFLHPAQRELVGRHFGGPARITGSAGTGKTVVALHRAVWLARQSADARVLLVTFSQTLAQALRLKLDHLIDPADPVASRITVGSLEGVARQLYQRVFGVEPVMASAAQVEEVLRCAAETLESNRFSHRFLLSEWQQVVDAWQIRDWPAYRDVSRLGRKVRVGGPQREALWAIFQQAQTLLHSRSLVTWAEAVARVAGHYRTGAARPFTHAVIDEAQDVSIPHLRFLAAIVPGGPDSLFFAGDLGQRIFQPPFSWLSQGVDVRGRSAVLKVNYRTSHQIRRTADLLLPVVVRDVDGCEAQRKGTISVFDGAPPVVRLFASAEEEVAFVGAWISGLVSQGIAPEEIGLFVRTPDQFDRARQAAGCAGRSWVILQDRIEEARGRLVIGTMHLAKGLEFKAVAVMACDDQVIPLKARIETASDEAELDDIFETERHLLYVACTRARDHVAITGVAPGSEFAADLIGTDEG